MQTECIISFRRVLAASHCYNTVLSLTMLQKEHNVSSVMPIVIFVMHSHHSQTKVAANHWQCKRDILVDHPSNHRMWRRCITVSLCHWQHFQKLLSHAKWSCLITVIISSVDWLWSSLLSALRAVFCSVQQANSKQSITFQWNLFYRHSGITSGWSISICVKVKKLKEVMGLYIIMIIRKRAIPQPNSTRICLLKVL